MIAPDDLQHLAGAKLAVRIITVDGKEKERYKRNLQELINIRRTIGAKLDFKCELYEFVLSCIVSFAGVDDANSRQTIISHSVREALANGKTSIPDIEEIIAQRVRRIHQQSKNHYFIALPINITSDSLLRKRHFTVGQTVFKVYSWGRLFKDFTDSDCQELSHKLEEYKESFNFFQTLFVCEAEATSSYSALYDIFPKYDLLRTALNFPIATSTWTMGFGAIPKPHAKVLPAPDLFVFDAHKKLEEIIALRLPPYVTESYKIETKHLQKSISLLKKLLRGDTTTPIALLVLDAFRTFGRGLDDNNFENGFLTQWQALEMLTCRPSEQNSNETIKSVL